MLLNCGVGGDTQESLDCKEIQSVHPKGNKSWIFIGRTDAEAEIPILWPLDMKNWLIWKDPDAGKERGQRRRGRQRMRWLDGITDSMDMSLWNSGRWWTEKPGVLPSMWSQSIGHDWATELILNAFNSYYNPTILWWKYYYIYFRQWNCSTEMLFNYPRSHS